MNIQHQKLVHNKLMFMLAMTQLLLIVDASIVNVIVPTISKDLNFSETGQSWIANAYLTVFGGALLVSGRIADLLGRARVFQFGLLILAVGSAITASATTPDLLITGRAVQGLGSALSAAASLALILATFEGEQRHKALGLLAAMGGLGGAVGTFLGGALTEWFGWRSTFWLSVVIPLALLLLSPSVFRWMTVSRQQGKVDGFGAVLLIVGQTLLAFGIISIGEYLQDGSYLWLTSVAASIVILALFGAWQRKSVFPLIPPGTWRNFGLMEALTYAAIGQFVIFPMFFIGNLYLQKTLQLSPMASGASFLPLCAVVIVTATNARLWLRFGDRKSLVAGFILSAIGMLWLSHARADGSFLVDLLGPTLFVGAGLPMIAISSNILGAKSTPMGEEGLSSGLLNTFQQFGAVLGLAAMISVANLVSVFWQNEHKATVASSLLVGYQAAFLIGAIAAVVATIFLLRTIFWTSKPALGS